MDIKKLLEDLSTTGTIPDVVIGSDLDFDDAEVDSMLNAIEDLQSIASELASASPDPDLEHVKELLDAYESEDSEDEKMKKEKEAEVKDHPIDIEQPTDKEAPSKPPESKKEGDQKDVKGDETPDFDKKDDDKEEKSDDKKDESRAKSKKKS